MAFLRLIPGGQSREIPEGRLLLDALLEMGLVIPTPCGGKGIFGKCWTNADGIFSDTTDAEKKPSGKRRTSGWLARPELLEMSLFS